MWQSGDTNNWPRITAWSIIGFMVACALVGAAIAALAFWIF